MFVPYGRQIPGLQINGKPAPYPVVNERIIRAAAGVMMMLGYTAIWISRSMADYRFLAIVIVLFWIDFFLKTVFTPEWSLFGKLVEPFVKKQNPEYVGAIQKRFAWSIGLAMSTAMVVLSILLEIRGTIPLTFCAICVTFMFLESAFGICVGCSIYRFLLQKKIIPAPEIQPACPGGVCECPRRPEN